MGIHLNFAPVLDVNSNARNPVIGVRSFGDDPPGGLPGRGDGARMQERACLPAENIFPATATRRLIRTWLRAWKNAGSAAARGACPRSPRRSGRPFVGHDLHILIPRWSPPGARDDVRQHPARAFARPDGVDGLILSDGMQMQRSRNSTAWSGAAWGGHAAATFVHRHGGPLGPNASGVLPGRDEGGRIGRDPDGAHRRFRRARAAGEGKNL